jgi:choline dehydrogenase-like flavoprotein
MHAMGGAIMGSDPDTSVTNSYGQTHEVANLFVAGPSLFPTSGAVNPNFTINAVTLRTAKYILKHWPDFA